MNGKEKTILEEVRTDIKALLEFMHTYTERSKGCAEKFVALEKASQWTKAKVLLILGFGGGIGFAIGIAIKMVK